jgi:protein-disulfide isomerase
MRKRITMIIMLCIVLIAFAVYLSFSLKITSDKNQLFKKNYEQGDVQGVYSALFLQSPAIHNRPYIGFENAPLTIIVIVDFQSELSKKFYEEKMPEILNNYINTGQAKLYHKYYISREELEGRKGRFIYASASRCYNEFAFNNTIEFNKALFSTPESSIEALAEEYSIPKEAFISCINNNTFQSLYEDMLETDQFSVQSPSIYLGVNGQDNTLLLGNPSTELIQKRMRVKQIKVGI